MPSPSIDSLGRRNRLRPNSTGKRVTLTARDLLWFEKLREHGPLPSSFLLEYSKQSHRSDKRALERFTDLFNEDNTPDGGSYLTRPVQQFRTIDSRYNQLVYDLTPAAERALKRTERWNSYASGATGPWLHSHMVACITSSIELATLDRPDLTYIPQSALLARAKTTLRYPTKITDPSTGRMVTKDLIPDAFFGLRYETPDGPRYRCFLVEADRSTEPAVSTHFNRKSWVRNLLQCQAYLATGAYRDHLKLKAPVMVLTVSCQVSRSKRLCLMVAKHASTLTGSLLFQTWPMFGADWRPSKPDDALLLEPWCRVGRPGFCIARSGG